MRTGRGAGRRGAILVGVGAAVVVALLAAGLSLILPGVLARDYDAKSLASLRRQAVQTRQAFSALLASLEARKSRFDVADLPADAADFFPLFREARLHAENEGIALSNRDGLIEAWSGNVLSPADLLPESILGPVGLVDDLVVVARAVEAVLRVGPAAVARGRHPFPCRRDF